jgi:hypothetical protein
MNKNNKCRYSIYAKFDKDHICPMCNTLITDERKVDDGWAYEYTCGNCKTVFKKFPPARGEDAYLDIIKLESDVIALKFIGIDSWHRPVFKAIDAPFYCGSIDHLFDPSVPQDDIIEFFEGTIADHLVYFGKTFDCEPMGTSLAGFIVVII